MSVEKQNNLKKLMDAYGYTRLNLSLMTGLDVSGIFRLENGEALPFIGTAEKIAKAFDLPAREIFPRFYGE